MMNDDAPKVGVLEQWNRKFQYLMDKSSPHILYRWIFFGVLIFLYVFRVYMLNGWFIVSYGLGIYLLNQLIGFMSPQFDPEDEGGDLSLPTRDSEEYRPFARRLPEFKFWLGCARAVLLSTGMTFFDMFDVPVFWPILLLYFIVLFFITMKNQIKHMIKHRYVPWSFGKKTYAAGSGGGKDSK